MPQGTRGSSGKPSGRVSHLSLVPRNAGVEATGLRPDHDLLSVALELADQAVGGTPLERRRYASLLSLLYEGVATGMPYDLLLDFARSKADELRSRSDQAWPSAQGSDPGS